MSDVDVTLKAMPPKYAAMAAHMVGHRDHYVRAYDAYLASVCNGCGHTSVIAVIMFADEHGKPTVYTHQHANHHDNGFCKRLECPDPDYRLDLSVPTAGLQMAVEAYPLERAPDGYVN